MTKFMILIYGHPEIWNSLSQQTVSDLRDTHQKIQINLNKSGELLDHKELVLEGSKILQHTEGKLTVSAGPFSEGRLTIAGYYLVQCASEERVLEIASQFKESIFAPIEIRALSGESSWE